MMELQNRKIKKILLLLLIMELTMTTRRTKMQEVTTLKEQIPNMRIHLLQKMRMQVTKLVVLTTMTKKMEEVMTL